jgi:hypothetical protein
MSQNCKNSCRKIKKMHNLFERNTNDNVTYMQINGLKVGEECVDASLNISSHLELRAQEGNKIARRPELQNTVEALILRL